MLLSLMHKGELKTGGITDRVQIEKLPTRNRWAPGETIGGGRWLTVADGHFFVGFNVSTWRRGTAFKDDGAR